jgi:hypothetical protein
VSRQRRLSRSQKRLRLLKKSLPDWSVVQNNLQTELKHYKNVVSGPEWDTEKGYEGVFQQAAWFLKHMAECLRSVNSVSFARPPTYIRRHNDGIRIA